MKKIKEFLKKETVLVISWILAAVSCFFVKPDKEYISYIDFRSLGILWSLMVIMEGFQLCGVFEEIGQRLLRRTKKVWQLCSVLIFLCFFSGMLITNDVALITFVPFALLMLKSCKRKDLIVPVVVLQTVAANMGSMLTPVGNPQNLYLYGISQMSAAEFILWMLPYTGAAFLLLTVAILFLKGKTEPVSVQDISLDGKVEPAIPHRRLFITVYAILFLLALAVVLRFVSYYILAASVLLIVLFIQRKALKVDYALLLTFVGFFVFTGNLGRVSFISELLMRLIDGREILVAILVSQCISNVPAALLLSGFTNHYKALLLGVDLGGLGTLIASMASLISYKLLVNEYPDKKGSYIGRFTVVGVIFLGVLLALAYLWKANVP